MFPVTQKNYNSDPAISAHWRILQYELKNCWAFTIFGYSAPSADVEAIKLLKDGWGDIENRDLEEVEIIDIRDEDELRDSWDKFIHTHHYTIKYNFYDSWIAQHPRRSCEALWAQDMDCKFISGFPKPKDAGFSELYEWLRPRVDLESISS